MKYVLAVLLVASLALPASAEIFNAVNSGSWDVYVGSVTDGYGAGGGVSPVRMSGGGGRRSNWGWTSFYGATAASGGQTLSQYLTANPGASATLYVCVNNNLAANSMALETLRSGNTGGLVNDNQGSTNIGYQGPWNSTGTNIVGSSQAVAFRMGTPENFVPGGMGYAFQGDLTQNPTVQGDVAGQPWITPAGRTGSWRSGFLDGPGQNILYNFDNAANYGGYENTKKGIYAVADLLGVWGGNNNGTTKANVATAGQYLNGGMTTPSLIGSGNIVASDPKGHAAPSGYAWLAIPLDATMLNDVASNPQNKALVFTNALTDAGLTVDSNWAQFLNNGSANQAPYLSVVPEPATLCLLAFGGLALIRRKA